MNYTSARYCFGTLLALSSISKHSVAGIPLLAERSVVGPLYRQSV